MSSYICLNYHFIFSTKDRAPTITSELRLRLHAYLGGIIRSFDGVSLCVGGICDHVHIACSLSQNKAIADVIREIKTNSSKWVHREFGLKDFAWQTGYSAFTVSKSGLPNLRKYIENQEEHHKKISFVDELLALLTKHEIDYDEKYLLG